MDVAHDEELELAAAGAFGRLDALLRAVPDWRDDVAGRRDELGRERDVDSVSQSEELSVRWGYRLRLSRRSLC